jgi:hypothetical protein
VAVCDPSKVRATEDAPVDDRPDDGSAPDPVRPCPARELTRPPSPSIYIPHSKRDRAIGREGGGPAVPRQAGIRNAGGRGVIGPNGTIDRGSHCGGIWGPEQNLGNIRRTTCTTYWPKMRRLAARHPASAERYSHSQTSPTQEASTDMLATPSARRAADDVYVEPCPRIEWMGDGAAEGGLSRPGAPPQACYRCNTASCREGVPRAPPRLRR